MILLLLIILSLESPLLPRNVQNEPKQYYSLLELKETEYYYFYDENGTYWRTDGTNYWYFKNGKWKAENGGHPHPENYDTPINDGTIVLIILSLFFAIINKEIFLKKLGSKFEITSSV